MSSNRVFWGSAFAGYLLLWFAANYPALFQAWWYRDDFTNGWFFVTNPSGEGATLVYNCFGSDGRPLAFLVESLFAFNHYPNLEINIAFRWAQGIAHVVLSLLIAATLSRHLPRWQAVLAVIPFLIWAFNGEATLYFTASLYLLSALFSLCGLRFILIGVERDRKGWCAAGSVLTICSFLTMQSVAIVGFTVWLILLVLRSIESGRLQKLWRWEALWLLYGNLAGGALTKWITLVGQSRRAGAPSSLLDKFDYWLELNRTFLFWPHYYPLALKILHILLLVLGFAIPTWFLLKTKHPRTLVFVLLVLAANFVLPYLANLIVAVNLTTFRTFYIAPLVFVALFSIALAVARQSRWISGILAVIVAILAFFNIGIAQANARDYVTLYNNEVQAIHDLEKVADQNHYTVVFSLTDSAPVNPFGLTYPWTDGHECDFKFNWSAKTFIELYSPLKMPWPSDYDTTSFKKDIQNLPATPGIHFYPIPERQLIYVQAN